MSDNLPPLPISLEKFTELAHRTASRYSHRSEPSKIAYTFLPHTLDHFHHLVCAAIEADRVSRDVPAGMVLVTQSLIDAFPEINPSNYGHDDACELNRWGCEVVTTAIAASPQPQPVRAQPSGWQPIETAPKDGRTMLLGYFNSANKWRTMRGQWMSDDYIAEYWEEPDDVEAGWFETCVEADEPPNCWGTSPTHWMPLPPPPAEQAQKEE